MTGPRTSEIARLLRERQAERGWTLDEIVAMSGLARTTVHRALKGETALPAEVLIQLALAMGLDPGELVRSAAALGDGDA